MFAMSQLRASRQILILPWASFRAHGQLTANTYFTMTFIFAVSFHSVCRQNDIKSKAHSEVVVFP
jgi:hypothetical protein